MPRSRKNKSASNICRPSRCTCPSGKQPGFFVYFRLYGSLHSDYFWVLLKNFCLFFFYLHLHEFNKVNVRNEKFLPYK